MKTDYEALADRYAAHRRINPEVLDHLCTSLSRTARVLEVGCGTGNYLCALREVIGCDCLGIDPSIAMLEKLQARACGIRAIRGVAELLDLPDQSVDLVYCVDAVHHFTDRSAAFREAFRVLGRAGRCCIVTDSDWIIRHRVPLASHFPETAEIELARYPSIDTLTSEMRHVGFRTLTPEIVEHSYVLTDASPYRDKVFSSLLCLSQEVFQRGLSRLEADLQKGPLRCVSRYCLVWSTKAAD